MLDTSGSQLMGKDMAVGPRAARFIRGARCIRVMIPILVSVRGQTGAPVVGAVRMQDFAAVRMAAGNVAVHHVRRSKAAFEPWQIIGTTELTIIAYRRKTAAISCSEYRPAAGQYTANTFSCQLYRMRIAEDAFEAVLDADTAHSKFAYRRSDNCPYRCI